MDTEYTETFHFPTIEEFSRKYKRYNSFIQSEGRFLFDLIMTPESFINARAVTRALGRPAVAGVAKACDEAVKRQKEIQPEVELNGFTKQYIGAVVCTLMEANGYHKTGEKRYVQYPGFTKGEYYEPNEV